MEKWRVRERESKKERDKERNTESKRTDED